MKLLIVIALFFWFICGFAGEWRLDGLDDLHWKGVARGPLTLVEALNEDPVHVPGTG
jgi:hypothetical protein